MDMLKRYSANTQRRKLPMVGTLVLATSGILAGGAALADRVVSCGVLIQSALPGNLCAKAEGFTDAAPVRIETCPSDPLSNAGHFEFVWQVYELGDGRSNDHTFTFKTLSSNGVRRMEVRGWSHDDHGPIQIWGPNVDVAENANSQKWQWQGPPNGSGTLKSLISRKCLDVPLHGGVPRAGDQLQQYSCNNGENQRWFLRDTGFQCSGDRE